MHYLVKGALQQVNEDLTGIEEALLSLKEVGYLQNGVAVRVLSEKLSALKTEKSKLEDDLN